MKRKHKPNFFLSAVLFLLLAIFSSAEISQSLPEHQCGYEMLHSRKTVRKYPVSQEEHSSTGVESFLIKDDFDSIRFGVFTKDLDDSSRFCHFDGQQLFNLLGNYVTCSSSDVFSEDKRALLIDNIIPKAVSLHTERLKVIRTSGSIVVPDLSTIDPCMYFSIPPSHKTVGISGYDFLLYVAAVPTPDNVVAWATTCAVDIIGRPTVGVANISPRYLKDSNDIVRVVAHEIAHSLGFNLGAFLFANMVKNETDVRGIPWTLKLVSPTVVHAGASHFAYPGINGVELENQGKSGTRFMHWKRRNLKDELMAGVVSRGYYTELTLAAFEDLGFYKANFVKAEKMPWGYKSGPAFIEDKCITNGTSLFPEMFCSNPSQVESCTPDRLGIGYCNMKLYAEALPPYFEYFTNPFIGGGTPLMDYCPIVTPVSYGSCVTGRSAWLPGSYVSATSRCLDASVMVSGEMEMTRGICVSVQCVETNTDLSNKVSFGTYKIQFLGSDTYVDCPEGETVTPSVYSPHFFVSGTITCPSYVSVCSNPGTANLNTESPSLVEVNGLTPHLHRIVVGLSDEMIHQLGMLLLLCIMFFSVCI